MSFSLMRMIIEMPIPSTPKLLALTLASFADKNGECWPSYDAISERSGFKKRVIVDNISILRESGLFTVKKAQGNRPQYTFDLSLLRDSQKCTSCTSEISQRCTKRTSRSAPDAPQKCTSCTSIHIGNKPQNKSKNKLPFGVPAEGVDNSAGLKAKRKAENHPIPPADTASKKQPEKPRERDLLFDAIAEVCHLSPRTHGSSIGKAASDLRKLEPPITPDEVRLFAKVYAKQYPNKVIPKHWDLTQGIGIVRNPDAVARVLSGGSSYNPTAKKGFLAHSATPVAQPSLPLNTDAEEDCPF